MRVLPLTALLLLLPVLACAAEPPGAGERAPAVDGRFYPGSAAVLRSTVRKFLDDAVPPRGEKPIALVLPHAGYVYSGQIAAHGYRQAMASPPDIVVILGTNHTVPPFDGVSVYQGEGYRTPLGLAPLAKDVASALAAADPSFRYRPDAHVREHSEEVQVPFVQVAFPKARIVTAIVGRPDIGLAERFGKALAKALQGRKALVVASSDLSHYPNYEDAVAVDRETLQAVASLDLGKVVATIRKEERKGYENLGTCACGEAPILAAMAAAREMGARRGIVVAYANSGDTGPRDKSRVVGYGAVMFTAGAGEAEPKAGAEPLTEADKKALLALARATLESYLATGNVPPVAGMPPSLLRKQGAFVTLKKHGDLRGCIGHMAEDLPLAEVVRNQAIDAAVHDPRFRPVELPELKDLEIEISVLTPMAPVPGPEAIQVGRDGVLITKSGRRAVFLPQVAPEQGWSRDEMLAHLCRKAGLPADCWRSGAEFLTFQAIVFHETKRS